MCKQKSKVNLSLTKNSPYLAKATFFLTLTCLLLAISLIILPTPSLAQEPSLDDIDDVAKQMNCPTCVGVNLADCRTQTCEQWRDQIADLLAEGYTEQEILDYFEERYGTRVLLEPPRHGITLVLWVLPVVALIAGAIGLAMLMRKWNQPQPITVAADEASTLTDSHLSDSYLKQVEEDLDHS
ncbi:MAG: cytochrome c-type biogenesis protein CcmH [Anaerolineae bacterium]|nr:cytochrome c-type biogenesis protein CcmH [Anaerolineae bacterium]